MGIGGLEEWHIR